MEVKDLQERVYQNAIRYKDEYDIKFSREFIILKLLEELGELSESLLLFDGNVRPEKRVGNHKAKEKAEEEIADVAGMILALASHLDIDIEQVLRKKWLKN